MSTHDKMKFILQVEDPSSSTFLFKFDCFFCKTSCFILFRLLFIGLKLVSSATWSYNVFEINEQKQT